MADYITLNNPNPASPAAGMVSGSSPASKIDVRVGGASLPQLQFPLNLTKYQFVIIESQLGWSGPIGGGLTFEKVYKLPFPTGLLESYQVNYDQHQSMGDLTRVAAAVAEPIVTRGAGAAAGGGGTTQGILENLGGNLGAVGRVAGAALGISLTSFKSVTLKTPSYKSHELSWKFSPKNFAESEAIKQILYSLKTGMQVSSGGILGVNLVFNFPKVYLMFFAPNLQYLYRFKPCVLEACQIDYMGGNHAPAFFADPSGGGGRPAEGDFTDRSRVLPDGSTQTANYTGGNNPPESILLRTRWLELEYWTQEDFNRTGADSNDPFGAISWYNR